MARVQPLVAAHGKRVAGWEEIASVPLAAGAVVQYWNTMGERGPRPRRAPPSRRARGSSCRPGDRVYLDMKYDAATPLGLEWAGHVEVRDSYDWDPATLVDGRGGGRRSPGVEAPLWTETLRTMEDVETMLFPRLCAVAEVAWSPPARARLGRLPRPARRAGAALGRGGDRLPPIPAGVLSRYSTRNRAVPPSLGLACRVPSNAPVTRQRPEPRRAEGDDAAAAADGRAQAGVEQPAGERVEALDDERRAAVDRGLTSRRERDAAAGGHAVRAAAAGQHPRAGDRARDAAQRVRPSAPSSARTATK